MSLIEATEVGGAVEQAPTLEARGVTVRFGGLVALSDVSVSVPPGTIVGPRGPERRGQDHAVRGGVRAPAAERRRGVPRRPSGHGHVTPPSARGSGWPAPSSSSSCSWASPCGSTSCSVIGSARSAAALERSVHRRRAASRVARREGAGRLPRRPARAHERRRARPRRRCRSEPRAGSRSHARSRPARRSCCSTSRPPVSTRTRPHSSAVALRRVVDEEKVSMLLVEHDVAMVLGLSSSVTVLDFGLCIAQGTPDMIRNDPAVRSAYLGDDEAVEGTAGGEPATTTAIDEAATEGRGSGRNRQGRNRRRRSRSSVVSDSLLSVEGLNVRYGSVQALFDVSIDVPEGSVVAVLGANGAGKSTFAAHRVGPGPRLLGQRHLRGPRHHEMAPAPDPSRGARAHPRRSGDLPRPVGGREPADGGAEGRQRRPAQVGDGKRLRRCSRCWPIAGSSAPARCPVVSSRCWRWRGHWRCRPR